MLWAFSYFRPWKEVSNVKDNFSSNAGIGGLNLSPSAARTSYCDRSLLRRRDGSGHGQCVPCSKEGSWKLKRWLGSCVFFWNLNSGKDGCFFCVRGKFPKSPGWENPWNLGAPKQNQWLIAWRKNPRSRFRFSGFSDHFFTLWGCYVSIGAIETRAF